MNRYFPAIVPALAGVAFAVFLFLGFASVDPLREATDAELTAWWADTGNQRDIALSMYFVLASCAAFAFFLPGLRTRIAESEGGSAPLATTVYTLGIVFVASLAAGAVLRGGIGHAARFENEALPSADVLRTMTSLTFVLVSVVAFAAVGLMVATASYAILRTKVAAAWMGWAGVAVAALILVAVVLLIGVWTAPLLQLWTVGVSVEMWRQRKATAASAPAALNVSPARP
jgi:hypothetical protein